MNLFDQAMYALFTMPLLHAYGVALVGNIAMFAATLIIGHLVVRANGKHAITEPPPPITRAEILLAVSCVLLNTLVAVIGLTLWRAGELRVRADHGIGVLVDLVVLLLAMDLLMYVFHRAAHIPWLYPIIHLTHHRYENPRPMTLFVLNPAEVLGFGFLLIAVLWVYPASFVGILLYLAFNLAWGLIGHLGVEPFPQHWLRWPVVRLISTSTFHAEHHQNAGHNFGFYTLFWDKLFGTLATEYEQDFTRAADNTRGEVL